MKLKIHIMWLVAFLVFAGGAVGQGVRWKGPCHLGPLIERPGLQLRPQTPRSKAATRFEP